MIGKGNRSYFGGIESRKGISWSELLDELKKAERFLLNIKAGKSDLFIYKSFD